MMEPISSTVSHFA